MTGETLLTAIAAVGGLGGAYTVWDGMRKRRAAKSQAKVDGEKVVVASAVTLVQPLNDRIQELQSECAELRKQVKELSAEVEHQRQVVLDVTSKLEAANRRADYYQKAFDERAGK
jgi:chromosome segregation ATPase